MIKRMSLRHSTIGIRARIFRPFRYPLPVAADARESYLIRYPAQYARLQQRIPDVIAGKKKAGLRNLRIGVVGISTGEEMASVLGSILAAFDHHPEWGAVTSWQIEIRGLELDPGRLWEARERLAGLRPLVARRVDSAQDERRDYFEQTTALWRALNRAPAWAKSCFEFVRGDAYAADGLSPLLGCDFLFFNAVDFARAPALVTDDLAKRFGNAFVFATAEASSFGSMPGTTHQVQTWLSPAGRLGFSLAVPFAHADAGRLRFPWRGWPTWRSPTLRCELEPVETPLETTPRGQLGSQAGIRLRVFPPSHLGLPPQLRHHRSPAEGRMIRRVLVVVFLGSLMAGSSALAKSPRARKVPGSPVGHALVRTVPLLPAMEGNAAEADVMVLGFPARNASSQLVVLNGSGDSVLFQLKTCGEAGGCFKRFGKVVQLPGQNRGLELILVDAKKRENVRVLACTEAKGCHLVTDTPRMAVVTEPTMPSEPVEPPGDPADLEAARAMVDEMRDALAQMVVDVEAAGTNAAKIKQIGDDFKKNGEALKARGEILQAKLNDEQKKNLEAYGREQIGPLMGKLMAAMMKAQSASQPQTPDPPEETPDVAP